MSKRRTTGQEKEQVALSRIFRLLIGLPKSSKIRVLAFVTDAVEREVDAPRPVADPFDPRQTELPVV